MSNKPKITFTSLMPFILIGILQSCNEARIERNYQPQDIKIEIKQVEEKFEEKWKELQEKLGIKEEEEEEIAKSFGK